MSTIMIIRHAEKPSADGTVGGVTEAGAADAHELSVRGWQRAGALVRLFAPAVPRAAGEMLATPTALFATAATASSSSLRPQHTIGALAALIGILPNSDHGVGEEVELAAAATASDGPVLICWHHEHIVRLVQAIAGSGIDCPAAWPSTRFDIIWRLDRGNATEPWRFGQVPQLLLPGDVTDPIG